MKTLTQKQIDQHARPFALTALNKSRAEHGLPPLRSVPKLWWDLHGAEFKAMIHPAGAYTEDHGLTWHWLSNDAPCPVDACQQLGIPCHAESQQRIREEYMRLFLEEYRKRNANRPLSPEELAQMRAAFGPGAIVVNVVTGQQTKL